MPSSTATSSRKTSTRSSPTRTPPHADYAGRAFSFFDPYSSYLWVRVDKVQNVKIRQAMAVALDRASILKNAGGDFAGVLGDGVIKPNLGSDYAPTGWATDLFGQAVPAGGDAEFAKQLISQSGEAAPTLTYDYSSSPVSDKSAAIIQSSLQAAGFTINLNPITSGYYGTVFDDARANEFGSSGWGPDWPNASTIIPPLFTPNGGFDLSRVDDPAWVAKVDDGPVRHQSAGSGHQVAGSEQGSDAAGLRDPDPVRPHADHRGHPGRWPVSLGALRLVGLRPGLCDGSVARSPLQETWAHWGSGMPLPQ